MISLNDVLLAMSNIPVDDPIAEIWGRGLQGGYRIIKYTGALPITITANGDVLIDYRIYGADGGVGVVTENLLDPNAKNVDNGYVDNSAIGTDGAITNNINWAYVTEYIPVYGSTNYIIFMNLYRATTPNATGLDFYDENKNFISSIKQCMALHEVTYENPEWGIKNFITPENCRYIRTNVDKSATMLMLVAASTPPPTYIPYGYKLPMTVSMNYEYVFTGDESFNNSYGRYLFKLPNPAIKNSNGSNTLCSHFPYGDGLAQSGTYFFFSEGYQICFGVANEFPTISDFKQFLTDQYIAGTPVKLKYFLAPSYFPVYIGENQLDSIEGVSDYVDKASEKIVRRIKEYTFTGNEKIMTYGLGFFWHNAFRDANTKDSIITTRFSHFTARSNCYIYTLLNEVNTFGDDCACFRSNTSDFLLRSTSNFTTLEECKAYLKAQYDNGTPVKISYWLKTPVEEDPPVPLPEIPTIDGTTIIDYDGDPKPSQMYVKYKVEE